MRIATEGVMRLSTFLGLALLSALTGCADLACYTACNRHAHNSSSLVEFLYPNGTPPPQDSQPQLRLPLRVGLTFLPSYGGGAQNGLDAAQKEALMQEIRRRFITRKFVAEIVPIPDYYLQRGRGFEGLEAVQRLYGVDLMALVSYDQVTHEDSNNWSIGYATIVGAYFLKGTRHDISTLVDLAVVDPATAQMIEHFDGALTAFEAEVREGKANVRIVSNNGRPTFGGGGSLSPWLLLLLLPLTFMRFRRSTLKPSGPPLRHRCIGCGQIANRPRRAPPERS
jgi:hypothetical protein